MKTYTIISSETIVYRTTIQAKTKDEALDIFCNTRIIDESILVPDFYEGFSIDSIAENKL